MFTRVLHSLITAPSIRQAGFRSLPVVMATATGKKLKTLVSKKLSELQRIGVPKSEQSESVVAASASSATAASQRSKSSLRKKQKDAAVLDVARTMADIEPAEQLPPGETLMPEALQTSVHKDLFEQMHKLRELQESLPTIGQLTVKAEAQARIQRGHLWIYANDVIESLPSFSPGQIVHVRNKVGAVLGTAYVNPRSLIAGRLLSRRLEEAIDNTFFYRKFEQALKLRQRFLGPDEVRFCRLVHGEGDGVPGLVVDRFGDVLVLQAHTLGIDAHLPAAVAALQQLLDPKVIVERSDVTAREHEGLSGRIRTLVGETDGKVEVTENGVQYTVDVLRGQKTGFFYDQREARRVVHQLVQRLAHPKFRFLDLYCYTGSFALNAARAGASFVFGVDASPTAIEYAQTNARKNGLDEIIRFKKADVETVVSGMIEQKEKFDMVVCDPPALVKSSKKKFAGLRKMRQVHEQAMRVVASGGTIICSSCDHLVPADEFASVLAEAAERAGRTAQIVWRGFAGPDHPVPLGAPEPDYLCTFILRLS